MGDRDRSVRGGYGKDFTFAAQKKGDLISVHFISNVRSILSRATNWRLSVAVAVVADLPTAAQFSIP